MNIKKNIQTKKDNYLPLTAELKRLYDKYTFEIVPVVLSAAGLVTSHLGKTPEKIRVTNIPDVTAQCQKAALFYSHAPHRNSKYA